MEIRIGSDVFTDQNRNWVVEVDEKLKNMKNVPRKMQLNNWESTIYKVPAHIRENFNYSDYAPYKVSFGPYYHGHESCRPTEDIKERALLHSLKRSNKTTNDYVGVLSEVVLDLRGAYDELDRAWQFGTEAFLKLMVYDGCFILEILREVLTLHPRNYSDISVLSDSPIWDVHGISPRQLIEYYRHDMLLLENQVPMLVLQMLLAVQENMSIQEAQERLHEHILKFIYSNVTIRRKSTYLHTLDLYRHSLLYQEPSAKTTCQILFDNAFSLSEFYNTLRRIRPSRIITSIWCLPLSLFFLLGFLIYLPIKILKYPFMTQSAAVFHINIPSATDLKEGAGIVITRSNTKSLMDISFRHRNLRLPQIYVDGATKSRLLNVIAFEQLYEDVENEVTSYVYFMSGLLKSANDVRLVQLRGIIHSSLHGDEVVEIFNSLTKETKHDPHIFLVPKYRDVGERLTESFYKMNEEWRKDLWQNYLKSPWAIVSLIAAFLLFALTAVQTVYTVLSYYNLK